MSQILIIRLKQSKHVACIIIVTAALVCGVLMHAWSGSPGSRNDRILNDVALIDPGFGAEGIVLGEDINAVIIRFGKSRFKISKPARENELFAHVFRIAGPVKIYFDAIYNNEERTCAVCVFRKKVVAIIGFGSERTTADRVALQGGAENFIFNYGNKGLRELGGGLNKMYAYPGLGIAVVDDDADDTIDLYFVFNPGKRIGR